MVNRWENVSSTVIVELTDEMRDELGLFDDAKSLEIRAKHSGYDDPGVCFGSNDTCRAPEWDCDITEMEGDVVNEDDDLEPLSAEQIDIILEGGDIYDAIVGKIMNGG